MHLIDYARDMGNEAINNHAKFRSFGWHDEPEDSEQWTVVYTHNRDSDALERSNAAVIAQAMAPYLGEGDANEEHHGHWAVGWVDGYSIRVFNEDGEPTPAWLAYCELAIALEEYPVLDEMAYSELQWEEASEQWGDELSSQRVAICKDAGASIFNARRDLGEVDDRIFEYLTTP